MPIYETVCRCVLCESLKDVSLPCHHGLDEFSGRIPEGLPFISPSKPYLKSVMYARQGTVYGSVHLTSVNLALSRVGNFLVLQNFSYYQKVFYVKPHSGEKSREKLFLKENFFSSNKNYLGGLFQARNFCGIARPTSVGTFKPINRGLSTENAISNCEPPSSIF